MESETKQPLTRKLIGYFMVETRIGGCIIVDPLYSRESLNYLSLNEEYPEIIIPVNEADIRPTAPRFYDLGYIPVGVNPPFQLSDYSGQEKEIPEYVDIPVYAISQGDLLTSIAVEIEEWIPSLKILDEEQDEAIRKKEHAPKFYDLMPGKQSLRRHLLGYVTATGGGIVICHIDFVRMCREFDYGIDEQLTVPEDGEDSPGFRVGVNAHISEESLLNREFPVYGEYEGDSLKRITIEIVNAN